MCRTAQQGFVGEAGQPLPQGQRPRRLPDTAIVRRRLAQGLGEAGGGAERQVIGQAWVSSREGEPVARGGRASPVLLALPVWPVRLVSRDGPIRQVMRGVPVESGQQLTPLLAWRRPGLLLSPSGVAWQAWPAWRGGLRGWHRALREQAFRLVFPGAWATGLRRGASCRQPSLPCECP